MTMTVEEIDAHLFALGITSDARGVDVMILGVDIPKYTSQLFHARLAAFGACVWWQDDLITNPELQVDYFVAFPQDNAVYDPHILAGKVLRPGGRYMVLFTTGTTDTDNDLELTDVRQVGDGQIRAIGWKRRVHGEVV